MAVNCRDAKAIGPVVPQAEIGFDRYWNSRWAYPIGSLRKPPARAELERERARFFARAAADRASFPYVLPHDRQEALLLFPAFGWVHGVTGTFCLVPDRDNPVRSSLQCVSRRR